MAFNKDRYKLLKELGGYSAKEANIFARRSEEKVKALIEHNILHRLDMGEKLAKKDRYKISRYFGFSSKESTRLSGFSIKNLFTALKDHALPTVGNLIVSRPKDGIEMTSAFSAGMYQQKNYMYKVEYYVDTGFTSHKKFVTVTSNKKLTNKQVYNHIVNTQFPKHEEEYEAVPLPNTIKITQAYYMTTKERKQMLLQRDADFNAKKDSTRNRTGKK